LRTLPEIVLHDRSDWRKHLLPLAFTRPVGGLRVGILTLAEKWARLLDAPVRYHTEDYLQAKFPPPSGRAASYLVVRANLCPDENLAEALQKLPLGSALKKDGEWLAFRTEKWTESVGLEPFKVETYAGECHQIRYLEDIFLKNPEQIRFDFALLTHGQASAPLSSSNRVLGNDLFVGGDVRAEGCTFDTASGPVYIADGAVLEEGAVLKGPVAVCAGARVKTGSRLYPNVTIGPRSTIAGEVNNAVLFGDAAKGHEGYLGCAVLGEGCNLGAGTSNSNLLNTWKEVAVFDYAEGGFRNTGELKVGTFFGDYAMCGINSSITTGSVVGVGAQLAIPNIIPKFVPDFSWWTPRGKETYRWEKFAEMFRRRAKAKNQEADETTLAILETVYHLINGQLTVDN